MCASDVSPHKIEEIWINSYHGGTDVSPYDQHMYIDNVVIARSYIGPWSASVLPDPDGGPPDSGGPDSGGPDSGAPDSSPTPDLLLNPDLGAATLDTAAPLPDAHPGREAGPRDLGPGAEGSASRAPRQER